jgi:hypothetical protein
VTLSRAIGLAAIVTVAAIVAAAFATIGPPGRARTEALDQERVSDLGTIAAELHDGYNSGDALPAAVPEQKRDPVTKKPYEYRRTGDERYKLCATFDLPTPSRPGVDMDVAAFWHHPAGRFCYTFDARRPVESTL